MTNRKPTVDLFISSTPYGSTVWDIRYINGQEHANFLIPSQDGQQMLVGALHFWTEQAAIDYCASVHEDYNRYYNEFVSITHL